MRITVQRCRAVLGICLGISLAALAWAGPDKNDKAGNPAVDQQLADALKAVINEGARLYNKENDVAGCYRVYQGGLLAVKPLLAHHPDLQQTVDKALADTDQMSEYEKRARTLNSTLFALRKQLKPAGEVARAPGTKTTGENTPPSLWKRLGGETAVRQVVDDFVALAAKDDKVNFTRNGKYKLDDAKVADLKQKLVELISEVTGGPLKYTGKDMKEVHKGMGITDTEFDALAADLKKAIEKNGVKPAELQDVLTLVGSTRKDIVETKKPAAPKTKDKAE
jgi:hemoglobin